MGRLFWKFFLFIWLGQMAAVIGTGMLFWIERHGFETLATADQPPPPPRHLGPEEHAPPPNGFGRHEGRPPPGPPGRSRGLPLMPVLAGLLASIFCAAGLAWYFAKPIRRLRSGFEQVANGELGVRVGKEMGQRRDELADLGLDFDRMAERLQLLVEGQKRLLHDVSHELRSPLARLQAATGIALQQPERIEDALQRIERESERMNCLIGELLTLSRLEAGVTGVVESIDVSELLAEIVEDARFEGADRQITIDYVPGEMGMLRGNSELLHRAIENVVRNALRYSPPGGVVHVEAGKTADGEFAIRVEDQGPGVADSELTSIFIPFHRGAAHRSGGGYGLGLAIARRVLLSYGGSISACNGSEGGLVVQINIPI